ncbi:MAG: hypothetical protein CMJ65_01330 [Planctomycetaceae bacterium]|nr:hypothetical protein [Planctomycetaceae bacterium]MDP7275149.1 DUF1501 domain-containing protein [Planctomycetaceae bacterium]
MLRIQGRVSRLCDGLTRRDLLQAGGLGLAGGLSLPDLLAAEQDRGAAAPARSVILINLLGGPSHLDMFDMKPDAPAEVRGEFRPIRSNVPGLDVCELMPQTARTMHQSCVVRTHTHLYNTHSPYNLLTGYSGPVVNGNHFKPSDHPSIGSVMQVAGIESPGVPNYVWMPAFPGHSQSKHRAGPYGGFLGQRYDPLFTTYEPKFRESIEGRNAHVDPPVPYADPQLPALDRQPGLGPARLDRRRDLLAAVDGSRGRLAGSLAVGSLDHFQQKAMELLTSTRTRDAFDLSREKQQTRRRYGDHLFGSCLLTARRLVQAGTRFVGITFESQLNGKIGGGQWDTHGNNFKLLKNFLLPTLDQCYSALVEDLHARGMLDDTLVVLMGEMGRTPKVNKSAGRDHWTQCGFIVYTGAGIRRGTVYGRSDRHAAWPVDHPVSSADHVATMYDLVGVDPQLTIFDRAGRGHRAAFDGEPVTGVIA